LLSRPSLLVTVTPLNNIANITVLSAPYKGSGFRRLREIDPFSSYLQAHIDYVN
jgi:hypothetical protein